MKGYMLKSLRINKFKLISSKVREAREVQEKGVLKRMYYKIQMIKSVKEKKRTIERWNGV